MASTRPNPVAPSGQTVNIASRVQNLADSRNILASGSVVENPQTTKLLESHHLTPLPREAMLRGIGEKVKVYEIP